MHRILIGILLVTNLLSNDIINNPYFASRIRLFEEWINTQMDYLSINGVSVGIIHNQELVYSKGFGYANDGDTLGMLVAVLNSNFWLSTHVTTITTGYGTSLFAGLIGHLYLIQGIRFPKDKKYLKTINANMYDEQHGIVLIFNKLKSELQAKGLKEMDLSIGKKLDTEFHEAISNIPTSKKKEKGKIIEIIEKGYFLGEKVIRYAKVVVGN